MEVKGAVMVGLRALMVRYRWRTTTSILVGIAERVMEVEEGTPMLDM